MATLSSSSTDAEVWAAYDDNASYDVDGSVEKARAFVEACRILRRRLPDYARTGNRNEIRLNDLARELDAALEWLAAHGGLPQPSTSGTRVKYLSCEGFRD